MGVTIGFPSNFLRPWTKSLLIEEIKVFFIVYNVVAFSSRIMFRRAPQSLGLERTILLALGFMIASFLLYLVVEQVGGMLWLPAIAAGLAHSFLFPSVITACSNAFPNRHRGLAMNMILGMYDLGVLLGMPAIGFIVTESPALGWKAYPTTFLAIAVLIGVVALAFARLGIRNRNDEEDLT